MVGSGAAPAPFDAPITMHQVGIESDDEDHHLAPARHVSERPGIDFQNNRFPFCVVWQPFPPLTWFIPWIGHTGIADSTGRIFDFQGPYTVIEDDMMLGRATKYLPLDPDKIRSRHLQGASSAQLWDAGVNAGCCDYKKRIHCLIYPNCNHHVAHCMNKMEYGGWRHYEMFQLQLLVLLFGKHCGLRGLLISLGPFTLVVIALMVGLYLTRWS
mmetsp:Transcript_2413/g.4871  ORF Transcript_2413/g.4871 Transcript_2413/m.4871 type:complete len:213 (+) Transcript_2413:18-656(+)